VISETEEVSEEQLDTAATAMEKISNTENVTITGTVSLEISKLQLINGLRKQQPILTFYNRTIKPFPCRPWRALCGLQTLLMSTLTQTPC